MFQLEQEELIQQFTDDREKLQDMNQQLQEQISQVWTIQLE